MASLGWSPWDTGGALHFRTFTDSEGQIRYYQWNNKYGHYTTSSNPRSAIVSRLAVEKSEMQVKASTPRSTSFSTLEGTTEHTGAEEFDADSRTGDYQYQRPSLPTLSIDPANSLSPGAEEDPETSPNGDVPQIGNDDLVRGLRQHGKPFEIHKNDVDLTMVEIKSQGSVRVSASLPPEFVIQHFKFFRRGRVFCAIHATAGGQSGKDVANSDGTVYVTLRPMVVIQQEFGHCLVVPVFSYQGQGLQGKNLTDQQRQNHAVIHMKGINPRFDKDEGMIHKPFTVTPAPYQSLTMQSRIRFDIWHTVQYNTKVKDMGMIDRTQHARLMDCFKATLRLTATSSSSHNTRNDTLSMG